jgi:uncharacterized membrane protein YhaH (DUF805 family)
MENVQQPRQQAPQMPPQPQYQQPQYQQPYPQQPPFMPEAPAMDFGTAIKTCFNKYADFSGRATRAEYWWFALFTFIVTLLTCLIPIIGWLVSVALLIPGLAVSWRRLHDIGRAGGWYFICFIPLVGSIILLVWDCTKSEPRDNRFGPYLG